MMHWRCPLVVLLTSIPLWAIGAAVPPAEPGVADPVDDSSDSTPAARVYTTSHRDPLLSQLDISCQAGDESFHHLGLEVSGSWDSDFCGNSQLLVNGRRLEQDWWQSDSDWSASGILSIDASKVHSNDNHSLVLESISTCAPSSDGGLFHLTTFSIVQIDGLPTSGTCGFSVSYNGQGGQRVMTLPSFPSKDASSADSPAINHPPSAKSEDASTEPSKSELVQQNVVATAPALRAEIARLRTLEADLSELTAIVEKQRQLVDGIVSEKHAETFSDCEDVQCYIKTIAHKTKGCIHLMLLRYGPGQEIEAFEKDHDCVWPEGRAARMQVLMTGKPLCLNASSSPGAGRLSIGDDSSASSDYSTLTVSLNEKIRKEHKIHLVLGTILSALCLSCFCVFLHRRCCNPRRRAERAARREERARRREYRSLSRRKAWKDWWNVRVMRNTHGASTDYEEKRGLILSQEAILERAMQDEIRVLRAAHTGVSNMAAAAEEGRAYASDDESLPAYRSRAGSGRPPSYHEYMTVQSHASTGIEEAVAARLDTTPDSSVANLSPRHSSETLRTERSVI